MRRTLDSDEFQAEFSGEWEGFCEIFEDNAEEARFKIELFAGDEDDESTEITAWHNGEIVARLDAAHVWELVSE